MPDFTFTSPDNKQYTVSGPDGATPEQAFQILQSHLSGAGQPAMSGKDQALDIAKGAGTGLAEGAIGLAGLPGDIGSLYGSGIGAVGNALGASPDRVQQFKDLAKGALASNPLTAGPAAMFQNAPTSGQISDFIKNKVGELPQPQTKAGEIAQTAASFAPAMIGGPEGMLTKALTRVVAPTIGTEAAGALTGDNPYAKMAGAVLGGAAGLKGAEAVASRTATRAAPSLDQVKGAATGIYDTLNARNIAIPLAQDALPNLADDIRTALNNKGIRPSNAGSIHAAVDEIKTPANAGAPDVADLVAARQSIKEQLGKPDTNKTGAFVALGKIENAIEQNSPGTMKLIKEADQNYSAFKANQALDSKINRAEMRASGADSGLNLGNKIRQKVADYLLSSDAKYLSAENKASLRQVVDGTAPQAVVRTIANALGGGGGIGSTLLGLTTGAAGTYSGHPELALAPVAGISMRMAYNRMVAQKAAQAAAAIRSRSPVGQQLGAIQPQLPQTTSPALQSYISALLASSAMQPVQQIPQNQR